ALTVYGGQLIAGGRFTEAGGVSANNIARWNGTAWSALGAGATDWVLAFGGDNGDLGAAGYFGSMDGLPASHLARWNGVNWSVFGTGLNDGVLDVAPTPGGELLAAGLFSTAGGMVSAGVARWSDSPPRACYANCDCSTVAPVLNANDFQ